MPSLMAVLGLDASRFKAGLDRANGQAAATGKQIGLSLGNNISGSLAGMASVGAITGLVRHTLDYASKVEDLSQRLGIGTEAVQAWDYALKQNGSSVESAASLFEKLATSRTNALAGDDKAIAAFRNLGVAVGDLKGKRLEDIALQIAEVFKSGDPQRLIGDLRQVGGRSAGEMVAAFRSGLSDLVRDAKSAGVVIGDAVIAGLDETGDRMQTVWMQFVAGIAPALNFVSKAIKGLWRGLESGMNMGVAFLGGFQKGSGGPLKSMEDTAKELEAKWAEQDRLADERAKKRKEKLTGGADDVENQKAERAGEQAAKRREELAERLAKLQGKHQLDALTKEERITELYRRRAELAEFLTRSGGKLTEENRLKAAIDLEELKGEEERARRDLDKPRSGGGSKGLSLNELQTIGAYAATAPHEQQMLDTGRRSEGHLREIKEHVVRQQNTPQNRGVSF